MVVPTVPYGIRPARPGDAGAIAAVHVTSWRQAFVGLLPDRFLAELSVDRRTEDWVSWIGGSPTTHVLVVERDGANPDVGTDPDAGADHGGAPHDVAADDHGGAIAGADTIVGFAHAGPSRDGDAPPGTAELYTIYLLADTWGGGVGTLLHDAVLDRLSADGWDAVTLWVLGTNARARRFYERRGWRQVPGERTQEFGGSVVTDYRYGRPLPAT